MRSLILYGVTPRCTSTTDWPWGWSATETRDVLREVEERWGDGALLELFVPTEVNNDVVCQSWARVQRAGASPAMGRALVEAMIAADCRELLPAVTVPTLVLHRTDDAVSHVEAGRYVAERIPRSRFVELPGKNHVITAGELEPILDEIQPFLEGNHRKANDRVLATILCTCIGERSSAGDERIPGESVSRFQTLMRKELGHFGGRDITTSSDSRFATFIAPSPAIECARTLRQAAAALDVSFCAGIHAGECEMGGNDTGGLAFRIATAVASRASTSEILATGTVKDLVVGSDITFTNARTHQLHDVPGKWSLLTIL